MKNNYMRIGHAKSYVRLNRRNFFFIYMIYKKTQKREHIYIGKVKQCQHLYSFVARESRRSSMNFILPIMTRLMCVCVCQTLYTQFLNME